MRHELVTGWSSGGAERAPLGPGANSPASTNLSRMREQRPRLDPTRSSRCDGCVNDHALMRGEMIVTWVLGSYKRRGWGCGCRHTDTVLAGILRGVHCDISGHDQVRGDGRVDRKCGDPDAAGQR
jgi:hypothetical protein